MPGPVRRPPGHLIRYGFHSRNEDWLDGSRAVLSVGEGDQGATLMLGAGAEIVLGSTGPRLREANLNFTATGQGDGVIRIYTGTGGYSNGILNLGDETGISDVYVNGLINMTGGAKIGTANLHMFDGCSLNVDGRLIVRRPVRYEKCLWHGAGTSDPVRHSFSHSSSHFAGRRIFLVIFL